MASLKQTDADVLDYQDGTHWLNFVKYSDPRTIVQNNHAQGKAMKRGVAIDIFPLCGVGGVL